MAHKKGVGSTDNGRDSNAKFLGVKLFGGQYAKAGNILIRQRGTKYHCGENVYMGRDFTIHAKIDGFVNFRKKRNNRTYINIFESLDEVKDLSANGGNQPKAKKASTPKASAPKATPKAAPAPAAAAPKAVAKDVAASEAPAPAPAAKAPEPVVEAISATPVAAPEPKAAAKADGKPDKLTKIEGIGPKIAEHLNTGGINTFVELAAAPVEKLQEILDNAGPRYRMHVPDSWPMQSKLAAEGKWDELQVLQDRLDGGKIVD